MNKFDKFRSFCKNFRVILGVVLIAIGLITGIAWFYLGIIPLLVGIFDICPLCLITKKCTPKHLQKN